MIPRRFVLKRLDPASLCFNLQICAGEFRESTCIEGNSFVVSFRMLSKPRMSSTRSTMLLETREDKLLEPREVFADVQFGLQVSALMCVIQIFQTGEIRVQNGCLEFQLSRRD